MLTLTLTQPKPVHVQWVASTAAPRLPTRRRADAFILYSVLRCSARVPAQRRPRYCDAVGTADPTPELTRDGRMTDNYRIMALDH